MKHRGIGFVIICLFVLLAARYQFCPARAAETGVSCGGIHILKTDVLGLGLSGAGFQVAREATTAELMDSAVPKRLLKVGKEMLTVVYESFWNSRNMTGAKVSETISDTNGEAAIYGLPYGTYYLVESRAPEGYNQMTAPIRISIHKYSHLTADDDIRDDENVLIDNTVHIITIRYTLPDTGQYASKYICAAVISLMISCTALLLLSRLRRCRA